MTVKHNLDKRVSELEETNLYSKQDLMFLEKLKSVCEEVRKQEIALGLKQQDFGLALSTLLLLERWRVLSFNIYKPAVLTNTLYIQLWNKIKSSII